MTRLAYRPLPRGTHRLVLTWFDGRVSRLIPMSLRDCKRKASTLGELGMVVAIAIEEVR